MTRPHPYTDESLALVRVHRMYPGECKNCFSDNWGLPTIDGTTEAHDDGVVIWQCKECGKYSSLSAEEIREWVS